MLHITLTKGVRMTRRQWMWLWIWLLIFFIVFCIWSKLQNINSNQTIPTINNTVAIENSIKQPKAEEFKEVEQIPVIDVVPATKRDINLKVVKNGTTIKISGLFSSQDDVNMLKSEYSKISENVEEGTIIIDKNANNTELITLIPTLSENFAKFKSGYLEYTDKQLTIDGVVDTDEIKDNIGEKVKDVKNFSVDNRISVEKPIIEEVSIKEPSIVDIQAELDKIFKLKKVKFVYAKTLLTKDSKKIVNEVQELLKKHKNISIEIAGHTDSDGSRKNNKILSQKRANAIKAYLVSRSINAKRLKAIGYGESKPLVKENSANDKQINRRVEFKVIGE
jgi:outer membrane protein OmpA-like peptidoglycan-associated protein